MDTLVWHIARGREVADVGEDGSLDGDPVLVTTLRGLLAEPVTVHRRGTVPPAEGSGSGDTITLEPGDGRYMAARIRLLCRPGTGYEMVGCSWRE